MLWDYLIFSKKQQTPTFLPKMKGFEQFLNVLVEVMKILYLLQQAEFVLNVRHIGYAHYFPGINGNLKKDIAFNKKPICDMRTKEELALWNNFENKQRIDKRLEQDFNWLKNNLPDKAPKSLGGYKRMYNTKSANFKKLAELAEKNGYTLLS